MVNTVTHSTAQALKAAGFPQPAPQAGQFWYNGTKLGVLIGNSASTETPNWFSLNGEPGEYFDNSFIYAATPADIQKLLPGATLQYWELSGWSVTRAAAAGLQKFLCRNFGRSAI